jgi:alpha-tubulin suppressor-like RCC1 family protein
VVCWGRDDDGQVSGVPSGETFVSVSAGVWFTCGVRTNGQVVCWGSDDYGQVSGAPRG